MGKKEIKDKIGQINSSPSQKNYYLERSITEDDNLLPSPQELKSYAELSNGEEIVKYFLETGKKEQEFRHTAIHKELDNTQYVNKAIAKEKFLGMIFAFLLMLSFIVLAGYALYLDRVWISTLFGVIGLSGIASVFIKKDKK